MPRGNENDRESASRDLQRKLRTSAVAVLDDHGEVRFRTLRTGHAISCRKGGNDHSDSLEQSVQTVTIRVGNQNGLVHLFFRPRKKYGAMI